MAMLRYNGGKAPLSLVPSVFFEAIFNQAFELNQPVPTKLIWQVGEVLDFGAQKYSAHNWRKGGSWASVLNSAFRHLVSMVGGRVIDPESGLKDSGHLGCNIAFLLEFAHTGTGEDDRYEVAPVALVGDAEPSLIWVMDALLRYRDGGSIDDLHEAAWELARWVEVQDDPSAEPAAPPAPAPGPEPSVLAKHFPFAFPLNLTAH